MFRRLSYLDVLNRNLEVMDTTAISLCRDNQLPILVFNMTKPGNIRRVVLGEPLGTLVLDERRRPARPGRTRRESPAIGGVADGERRDQGPAGLTSRRRIEAFQRDLTKVRTGRANLAILDGVKVDYYGTPTPLNQVASVNVPDAAPDHHQALGEDADPGDREVHPRRPAGPEPELRRRDRPPAHAAADRGAPQGPGQAGEEDGRGGQGRPARPPPRRQRDAQGRSSRTRRSPRTRRRAA